MSTLLPENRDPDSLDPSRPAETLPADLPFGSADAFRARFTAEREARRSPHRLIRVLAILFPVVLVLAAALVFGARAWVRHGLIANLPQLDGNLAVPGLSAPVTVRRDARGVPHILAANLDDLVLAQGYVVAQDRLWQLDIMRRNAAGDLSEVLGAALLPRDRAQRTLGMRVSAEAAVAVLPPVQRHWLDQYARGVNASMEAQRDRLPIEFRLLRYRPAPWSPVDSILIGLTLYQDLGTSFPVKLSREFIASKLPPELVADLYPVGSWRDHPPGQRVDLAAPVEEIEQIPLDESQTRLAAPKPAAKASYQTELLETLRTLPGADACEACTAGSNNWAIAASHSTTGKPILANDTHLAHSVPGIWYEDDLQAGAFHAGGRLHPRHPVRAGGPQ